MSRKIPALKGMLKDGGVLDQVLDFGTWRTPSAERPVLVLASVTIQPSGVTSAALALEVDRSGGETAEDVKELRGPAGLGGAFRTEMTAWVPAGGSYQIRNVSNPAGGNAINEINEVVL